jgi:hypothetical protein
MRKRVYHGVPGNRVLWISKLHQLRGQVLRPEFPLSTEYAGRMLDARRPVFRNFSRYFLCERSVVEMKPSRILSFRFCLTCFVLLVSPSIFRILYNRYLQPSMAGLAQPLYVAYTLDLTETLRTGPGLNRFQVMHSERIAQMSNGARVEATAFSLGQPHEYKQREVGEDSYQGLTLIKFTRPGEPRSNTGARPLWAVKSRGRTQCSAPTAISYMTISLL